jgi:hypothetical protein
MSDVLDMPRKSWYATCGAVLPVTSAMGLHDRLLFRYLVMHQDGTG